MKFMLLTMKRNNVIVIMILKSEDKRRKTFRQKQLRYFGFLDPCPSIVGNVSPLKLYDVFKEHLHALKSILFLFMPIFSCAFINFCSAHIH